jgi:fatty-acid desaturase
MQFSINIILLEKIKMFNFLATHNKLRLLVILNHLIVFSIFFVENIAWYYWLIAFIAWILIGKVGGEIGFHRYFAHRSFKTSRWKDRMMLILGSLVMVGSSLSWAGAHRVHHAKADSEDDPHSPHHHHWFKVWIIDWKPFVVKQSQITDLLRDSLQIFLHRWYFEFCLLILIVIGLIDYKLLLFMISLPSIIQFHTGAVLVDIVCHKWGYRRYPSDDHSRNNLWANTIALGQGLHNNHHADPGNYNMSRAWWEIDISAWIIKYFLIKN